MRMAKLVQATLAPHSKSEIDANEFMLFPDAANDLPDDVSDTEKAWMMKLDRSAD